MNKKYFLDQDNSCHWYLVDVTHRYEWNLWKELDEDDERSWDIPEYAFGINGHPKYIEFELTDEELKNK